MSSDRYPVLVRRLHWITVGRSSGNGCREASPSSYLTTRVWCSVHIALVGIGATAPMDLWLLLLSHLGVPTTGFATVGRWVGHFARGRFAHAAIAKADPIPGALSLGWITHYVIGIAFAALLVALQGSAWLQRPSVLPALAFGAASAAAPWFVMQPAMGAGLLARSTPTPLKNGLRNLANHLIFGAALYAAAAAVAALAA